jgi:2-polyprenyl-3-methyl-5-hydroxy-6-metoxy-1,4-benzoquinol methylase
MTDPPRPCPGCGAQTAAPHWRKESRLFLRCSGCGLVYVSQVAPDLACGAHYDQAAAAYCLSPAKLESDYAPVRFQREIRVFRRFCAGGDVLDAGCATGAFLYHLGRSGPYRGLGVDVAGAAVAQALRRGVEAVCAPFLEHDFADRRFDAVTFWAVLEHLANPRAALARAASLLRPGGLCFALVPNVGSLAFRLLGSRYRYVMAEHLNYFRAAAFRRMAQEAAAFEVLRLSSMHFNPVVIWQDWRSGGLPVAAADRARLLQRTTAMKQAARWRPVRPLYRACESILGAFGLADNLVAVLRRHFRA